MATWVFVHAHPDDETLFTGALIATAARRERVIVITCTRGERGEVIRAPGTPTEQLDNLFGNHRALAVYRTGELHAALAALGPNVEHHFLDELPSPSVAEEQGFASEPGRLRYEDSGMEWIVEPSVDSGTGTSTGGIAGPAPDANEGFANADLDEAANRLVSQLQGIDGPIVVVTYEADGGYGHPDHVKAHQVTVAAIEKLRAAASGKEIELWEVTPAGKPHDLEIPVAPVREQLLNAMRSYSSQVQNVTETSFALSNGVPIPIQETENYRITRF